MAFHCARQITESLIHSEERSGREVSRVFKGANSNLVGEEAMDVMRTHPPARLTLFPNFVRETYLHIGISFAHLSSTESYTGQDEGTYARSYA